MTAQGANISGKVTATSGKIAGWEIDGNTLRGTKNSSYIVGGEINIGGGFFRVYDDYIRLGEFEVSTSDRAVFQSSDEFSGISAGATSGKFCIWGGYTGGNIANTDNYAFCVNTGGTTYTYALRAHEIYGVAGDSTSSKGYTIGEYLDWIYNEIKSLSDETVKSNIIPIDLDEALTFLLNSSPITFQYTDDGQWSAGFVAQQVEALQDQLNIYYPLVGLDRKEQKYKIYYRNYIPLLVAAIINLQNQINELKRNTI